jgi:SAM-dependent methyltransferase
MLTKSKYWYSIKRLIPGSVYEDLLALYYKLRAVRYKGSSVECPICEKTFARFVGGHACPSCGSGKRHRLLWLFLKERTNLFREKNAMLHFAPEHCFYRKFGEMENLYYVSADLNSPRAKEKVDMTRIQYAANSFDIVISSHVLEHVPDDLKAMRELHRVLKPGGWAIHQAPIDHNRADTFEDPAITSNEDRLRHYGHIDHKRIYGRDYPTRLELAGFTVRRDRFVDSFKSEDIRRYGLDTKETIYFCTKVIVTVPQMLLDRNLGTNGELLNSHHYEG